MSYFEFSVLLYDNISIFISIFVICAVIYYKLFNKSVNSIIDPFIMGLFASCTGLSVVLFLYITKNISSYYFLQYLLSQTSFIIGLIYFNPTYKYNTIQRDILHNTIITPDKRYFYLFVTCSTIYIILQLYTYKVVGIPLFLEYRLASVSVGGGFGLINRFVNLFSYITIYFGLLFYNSKHKDTSVVFLVFYILFLILSGSKSSILIFIQGLFVFYFINRDIFPKSTITINKRGKVLFIIAAIGAIITILISSSSIEIAMQKLFFRIVSYGDTYYMAYPDNNISLLKSSDWWVALTGDLLRTLRIIPEEKALPALGFELYDIANKTQGAIAGPNPRHNVFGYVNFGFYGSIIYSLICGCITGFIRNKFFNAKQLTQYRRFLLFTLYFACIKIETDPPAFMSQINDLLIILTFVLIVENVVFKYNILNNNENSLHDNHL